MTPNTSPTKPAWFSLIEDSAPSAQVRKVDKKLPAATAIVALAMVAFGGFSASGSMNFDSSNKVISTEVAQTTSATATTSPAIRIPAQSAHEEDDRD
jgi:hypothetical protein